MFSRISEGTLGSCLVRFGDFFVLHCHGVSGWRVRRFGGRHVRELSVLAAQKVYRRCIS